MSTRIKTLSKEFWLIYLASYVTLASVMFIIIVNSPPEKRFLSTILFLLYGILFAGSIVLFDNRPLYSHLYFVAQTAVMLGLINLHPNFAHIIGILFLPITSQGPLLLPLIPGFLWVFVYFFMTIIGEQLLFGNFSFANAALSSGGFLGFSAFGATLRQSVERRKKGDMLLAELQETYAQLQLYTEQAEQLAVVEERNRLAREMHDALGHRLTVAVVQLEGAKRLIPQDPDRAAAIVDSMRTQLKEALAELRQAVSSLRTEKEQMSEATDLKTAVSQLTHTFQNATGLPIHLHIDNDLPNLSSNHNQTLFRTVQESLTNIQRHANATEAWVTIKKQQDSLHLITKDNGQGFSGKIEDGRFGLRGLKERAQQLGGQLQIKSLKPTGTELSMTLPLTNLTPDT